jgi:hypothetical protein
MAIVNLMILSDLLQLKNKADFDQIHQLRAPQNLLILSVGFFSPGHFDYLRIDVPTVGSMWLTHRFRWIESRPETVP